MNHHMTLADVCRENGRRFPLNEAVVDGDTRLNWREFDKRVDCVAHVLDDLGVTRGARILWLAQSSFRFLETLTAAGRLGAIVCPANWRQSADELAFVIDDLAPTLVLWQEEEIGEAVRAARELATADAIWIRHDDAGPDGYEARVAAASSVPVDRPVSPDDALMLVYTAALIDRPAGSLLSHRNLLSMALVTGEFTGATSDSVFLNSGPLFHVANHQLESMPVYLRGGKNVYIRRSDAESILRIVHREKVTCAFLMPPTIAEIRRINKEAQLDIATLKSGAFAAMWADDLPSDMTPWGQRPGGYGQTEVTGLVTLKAVAPGIGSAGRPTAIAQVRVVDPAGREVADGETGEIVVRGDCVHLGYWRRPEVNKQRFLPSGWWRTTDLGRKEADGSLSFVGTMTRIIKSAAENVYPVEVEACLTSHPAVRAAAVIGVPDPAYVQSVKAVVVLDQTTSASAEDLRNYCKSRIASYKKPKFIEFVDELPMIGGRPDYDALDIEHGGGGYPGESDITKAEL